VRTLDAAAGQQRLSVTRAAATTGKSYAAGRRNPRPRRHTSESSKTSRLLIISPKAGSMTPEVEKKLRTEFADHLILEFDPEEDFERLLSPRAAVVVAGGDGTIEFVVRKLADSQHPVGILSLGTFNNFALSLGLPTDLAGAIEVARGGSPRPITLGRVNGHIFLEACAIGLFGETIALGDSAKDLEFGKLRRKLKDVLAAKPFQYELSGDFEGSGTAMSLVFSNTGSTGSKLPISDATPVDPYLEFSVHAGRTRTDIVGRALAAAVLNKHEEDTGQVFKFRRLEVRTRPRVRVYADNLMVGRTPAAVMAEVSAVKVLLP
jgi:diacylglycerol kinase (ATP)